eukprot:2574764-Pleurochrysis_carterae.AAC.1
MERALCVHDSHSPQLLPKCVCLRSSTIVTGVKERCKPEIEQYERCLKGNPSKPATCTLQLEELWRCSDGTAAPAMKAHAPQNKKLPHTKDCGCGEKHE